MSLFALRKHKHTHGKSRPYRCSKCDLSFTGHSQLAEHMAMHREDNFPCDICNRTFSCKSSRAEHRTSHSAATGDLPPLTFEDEDEGGQEEDGGGVGEEKVSEHEQPLVPSPASTCGQNFLVSDAFRQHHCSSSLTKSEDSSTSTKKSPVRTLGEEEEVDVIGEDAFNCFACSEQFSTKSCLLEHQNEHHPKEILKCEICGKIFKERIDLIQHERIHIAEQDTKAAVKKKKTRLSCFQCAAMFDTVQEMAKHLKTHCHQDVGQHRCDMCYKSFNHWSQLKKHQESHVGQVVYECTECDKAFAFPHLLEEHQLTHAGPSK
ncbi:hypothetical protein CRUP_021733 [Coryphaenoides rupestris]|nr:hypothetical protein CRUP_021733 [Coryphaenoides rupestris]